MSESPKPLSALFSKTLRRNPRARKSVRQEGKELLEDGIGRKSAKTPSKPATKIAALGAIGKRGGSASRRVQHEAEDIMARFDSDVQMKSAVERARNLAKTPALTKRERALERFKRTAADSPKSVKALLAFGLQPQQSRTLEQMLGQFFGQPMKLVGSPEVREAQASANKLIATIKAHWDAALPKGQTRVGLLRDAFARLKAELKKNPNLNPSRFIRKELFDPWRRRFMRRLGADRAFVSELKDATGIGIVTDSDVPRFSLTLKVGSTQASFGFDVDHAETRLSDAVRNAKRPEDLLSVVESEGMQLLTPRENRLQIEALRKASREYFEKAPEEALDYFRRNGISTRELSDDIEQMIAKLHAAGEGTW